MPSPNPYPIALAARSYFSFSAVSNASYVQRVTVSIDGGVAAVFTGRGEGVPMQTADGQTSYFIAVQQPRAGTVLFEYSTDGTKFVNANVVSVTNSPAPTDPHILTIGTEDAKDGDNNDTVMTMVMNQNPG